MQGLAQELRSELLHTAEPGHKHGHAWARFLPSTVQSGKGDVWEDAPLLHENAQLCVPLHGCTQGDNGALHFDLKVTPQSQTAGSKVCLPAMPGLCGDVLGWSQLCKAASQSLAPLVRPKQALRSEDCLWNAPTRATNFVPHLLMSILVIINAVTTCRAASSDWMPSLQQPCRKGSRQAGPRCRRPSKGAWCWSMGRQ